MRWSFFERFCFVPQFFNTSCKTPVQHQHHKIVVFTTGFIDYRFAFQLKDFGNMEDCEGRSLFLHHVHWHLRGGTILTAITGAAALLAAGGVADHVHSVHASIGQVLALSESPGRSGGAEQPSLGLLGAGGQARRGGEVVSVQVVRVVQGESIIGALLHVVVAPAEHVSGGRWGSGWRGWGGAGVTSRLHHVLKLWGWEGAQLTAVGIHLAPGATATAAGQGGMRTALHASSNQGGSPLWQEGFRGLSRGHSTPCSLEASVGSVGQATVALQGRHVAASAGWVLRQPQVAELALPAAYIKGVGGQVEGWRGAGGGQEVCRTRGGWGPCAGGRGRSACASTWKTHKQGEWNRVPWDRCFNFSPSWSREKSFSQLKPLTSNYTALKFDYGCNQLRINCTNWMYYSEYTVSGMLFSCFPFKQLRKVVCHDFLTPFLFLFFLKFDMMGKWHESLNAYLWPLCGGQQETKYFPMGKY